MLPPPPSKIPCSSDEFRVSLLGEIHEIGLKCILLSYLRKQSLFPCYANFLIIVKLIDKMSLGVRALKVEGPVAQKGSISLELR